MEACNYRMIYFKKIRWKNFLSTGNVFTEIDLFGKPTTLIVGSNGAGKSTLLDAISFGMFGKPFRKINKPQLLNSINQKNLVVEVEFSIGSVDYKIIRGMKPNIFEVYQNDRLLNQSAESKDYQEILETQILKVNHKSFSQVIVLGSATFQPFMQLPAAQRREIIEDLLDLQIFTTMNSILKDKLSENKESIEHTVSNRHVIESKIEMTKEHTKVMEASNEKLLNQKQELIKDTDTKIEKEEKAFNDISNKIIELQEQVVDNESVSKKINKLTELRHQIQAKVKILNEEIRFFNENESCPTCKQTINAQFRDQTVSEKQDKIKEIEDGLNKLSEEYEKHQAKYIKIVEIGKKIQKLELNKAEISTTFKSLKKYKKQLESEIQDLQEMKNQISDNKLAEYENELKQIELDYNNLVEEKNVLNAAAVLLKDNGIKSKIIKQYIPVINRLINKYLAAMDFFVSFELDEQFNEIIKSRYRDEFTYASFSEGEKQKIDLALLFTWRAVAKLRNSINTNLLILDETFDSSLDSNGTEYLINILYDVAKDCNIFIISHKETLSEKFTNVIKFKKVKNFSTIQE